MSQFRRRRLAASRHWPMRRVSWCKCPWTDRRGRGCSRRDRRQLRLVPPACQTTRRQDGCRRTGQPRGGIVRWAPPSRAPARPGSRMRGGTAQWIAPCAPSRRSCTMSGCSSRREHRPRASFAQQFGHTFERAAQRLIRFCRGAAHAHLPPVPRGGDAWQRDVEQRVTGDGGAQVHLRPTVPMTAHLIMVSITSREPLSMSAIAVRGVGSVGCSRSSCPMVNTVASPQSRRATCHAVAAGTTALITQLPLPFDRS